MNFGPRRVTIYIIAVQVESLHARALLVQPLATFGALGILNTRIGSPQIFLDELLLLLDEKSDITLVKRTNSRNYIVYSIVYY